jgi:hypothetical protein
MGANKLMVQYKVVEGPRDLYISHTGTVASALNEFSSIIQREAIGGWELVCINSMNITKQPPPIGCLGGIMAAFGLVQRPTAESITVNMLVFAMGQTVKGFDISPSSNIGIDSPKSDVQVNKVTFQKPSHNKTPVIKFDEPDELYEKTPVNDWNISDEDWACVQCGAKNKGDIFFCLECSVYRY